MGAERAIGRLPRPDQPAWPVSAAVSGRPATGPVRRDGAAGAGADIGNASRGRALSRHRGNCRPFPSLRSAIAGQARNDLAGGRQRRFSQPSRGRLAGAAAGYAPVLRLDGRRAEGGPRRPPPSSPALALAGGKICRRRLLDREPRKVDGRLGRYRADPEAAHRRRMGVGPRPRRPGRRHIRCG